MPKIPIDFTSGAAIDANKAITSKPSLNMFLDVNRQTGSKVIKSTHGYTNINTIGTGQFINAIAAPLNGTDKIYTFLYNSPNIDVYRDNTFVASYATSGLALDIGEYRLATNGINIVAVNSANGSVASDDFYVDINAGTITALTADPSYAGFGVAKDVAYKDSRYFFITNNVIFHGDLQTDAGQGVAFNALSFGELPLTRTQATGIEVASSLIYVMSAKQTVVYQNVGTTPFTLQLNTSIDIPVGCDRPSGKVVKDDVIYIIGAKGANASQYLNAIAGSNSQVVSDKIVLENAATQGYRAISFSDSSGDFVQFQPVQSSSATIVYCITTGQMHYQGVIDDPAGSSVNGTWYYQFYMGTSTSAYRVVTSTGLGVNSVKYGNVDQYDSTPTFTSPATRFIYYFDYIRNGSEPFFIKSARMSFGGVANAELFVSTDGDVYASLGSFDLSLLDEGSKVAEWRRINRYANQASFKVVLTANAGSRIAIIDGSITV